ncbi:MucR family transcriptional regulator [Methylobacterium sp. J-072]|uniref:MucR family transcriptional regulator n=1 Tax=Methylobacterium sp. J-072 TaxID=2836651 RepID=UPI001FBA483D|nr:MucR family transcriptional regulator [Methylobacterium sp. J-072]MCJ2095496.1 MucR family transcriptional regulator [Methylobacterium sp. J-072]
MSENTPTPQNNHIELSADIVAAYVSNNSVPVAELPALLSGVYSALSGLGQGGAPETSAVEKPTPAQIRKSVKDDALVSFIDGKPYKTLKRHLSGNGMTIEQYRERFGLPKDYPSTAASYSAQRSALAKSLGLGQQRRKAAAKTAHTDETITETPKKAGRSKKAAEPAAKPTKGRKKASAAVAAE